MSKKIRIHLTNEEYNLINKLTRQTKTDCWFCLDTDKEGFDCVKDLERGYKITLRYAIQELNDAIIPELVNITVYEMLIYGQLMEKLRLSNPFEEEIQIHEEVYAGNGNGINIDGCPIGGDISNDCADCAYACDYHFVNGECVRRD